VSEERRLTKQEVTGQQFIMVTRISVVTPECRLAQVKKGSDKKRSKTLHVWSLVEGRGPNFQRLTRRVPNC